jgi:hypothetical protein
MFGGGGYIKGRGDEKEVGLFSTSAKAGVAIIMHDRQALT